MAGRNVGSIEVTVEANTGKLRAQILPSVKKIGDQAGEVLQRGIEDGLDDVDTKQMASNLKAQITILTKELERTIEAMDPEVHLDTREARAEIQRLRGQLAAIEDEDVRIILDPETEEFRRALFDAVAEADAARLEIERADIEWNIEMNTALALAEGEAVRKEIEDLEAQMQLELDTRQATLELFAFKQRTEADSVQMEVELQILRSRIAADKAEMDRLLGEVEVEVLPDIDRTRWYAAKAWLQQWGDDAGEDAGSDFGQGFGRGFDAERIAALSALAFGDALASGLEGALAAATSVVSSALQAMGGAAGAGVGIFAALGQAMTAVVVGSQGVGDAMSAISEEFATAAAEGRAVNLATGDVAVALRNLSPNARAAALAFADMRDELTQVRREVQDELFAGAAESIEELADTALPSVTEGLKIAAASANEFAHSLADIAKETDFAGIIQDLDPALDDVFDAAEAVVDTLEPFLKAAAPAAERLAEMLERGAESLRDWVRANPTRLENFLDDGVTSLRLWTELLGSTADLLATVFDAGAESGDNFVVSLNNMIERWDAFLESAEGQDALSEFFDTGKEALDAFKPVLDGLKEAFDILVTPATMSNFQELGEAFGQMIPVIAELISLVGQFQIASAFADLLALVAPVLDFLNGLPGPLLETVGMFIAVSKAVSLVSKAITAMKASNPEILALSIAVSAVFAAIELFSGGTDTAKARTEELTVALQDQVDALIASDEALHGTTTGLEALNRAVFETGDGGEKLAESFATINRGAGDATLGIDDTRRVLVALREDGDGAQGMLEELARGYGLSGDAAKKMATLVNETDDNMGTAADKATYLGYQMTQLAEETGLPRDALVELFGALEETQDQAEDTNFNDLAQSFIDTASTSDEATQAMLAQAEANQRSGRVAEGVVPLYEELVRIMEAEKNAADDSTSANVGQAGSYALIQQAIEDSLAAQREREEALKQERKAAHDAYLEEQRLAEATERAVEALATNMGVPEEFADGLIDIGNAARESADAAEALTDAFDVLFGRGMDAQEAFDSFYTSISDLNEQLSQTGEDALPRVGSALEAVFGTTDAALGFREAMRGGVEEMLAYAEAATNAGTPSAEINTALAAMRDQLILTGQQFGLTDVEVNDFISSLMGTPELVSTVVSTPGLIDALLNAQNLTLLYDDAGNPVITEFEAAGIDPAMADVEGFQSLVDGLNRTTGEPKIAAPTIPDVEGDVEGLQGNVDDLGSTKAVPTVSIPSATGVQTTVTNLQTALDKLGRTTATPTVSMPSYSGIKNNIDSLNTAVDNLDANSASISITIPGIDARTQDVKELKQAIDNLRDRTITITTRQVTQALAEGGIAGPLGALAGEAGPERAVYPSGAVRMLTRPTMVPPGTAVTPLTGDIPGAHIGRQVNVYNTIQVTSTQADPRAVATQVMNRAAAMAN